MRRLGQPFARERDHRVRGVDTEHGTAWQPPGDLGSDRAVAAADVEHALAAVERQAGEALLGQPALERRDPVVDPCIPLGHAPAPRRAIGSAAYARGTGEGNRARTGGPREIPRPFPLVRRHPHFLEEWHDPRPSESTGCPGSAWTAGPPTR